MKIFVLIILSIISIRALAQQQLLMERRYLVKVNPTEIKVSAQDKQGNIYYSGTSLTGVGRWDNYFLKVKGNTDTLWTRKNPVKLDYPDLVIQAMPNGEIVTGSNFGNQQMGMSLHRINTFGTIFYTKNFTSVPSMLSSILVLPGKDLLIGGGYGTKDFAFTRTDSMGIVKWSKGYPWGGNNEALMDIKQAKSGNIIAAGITDMPVGPAHIKLMLVNQNGDSLLGRQLIITDSSRTETMNYGYSSVTPISDGGYLVTAAVDTITAAAPGGTYMGMVVKVDPNLYYQWKYIHRNAAGDEYKFTRAKELTDGTIIVLGFKIRPIASGNINKFQIFHFSAQGQLLNVYPFNSNICTQVYGMTLDALPDSTLLIGGRCGNSQTNNYAFYVAKVKIPGLPRVISGLPEYSEAQNLQASLGQTYPNPANSTAIIPYTLPIRYKEAKIQIRYITGREVGNYTLKPNSNSLEINLSNLNNGLYTYTLLIDEKPVATKKLAVLK